MFEIHKNIPYEMDVPQALGDLYLPSDSSCGAWPVVVCVHGGSWKSGTKSDVNMVDICTAFASNGIAAFSIDYRLVGEGGGFPQSVIDVKQAALFLQSHAQQYRLDRRRIGCFGASAGAHLALMAAYAANSLFIPSGKDEAKSIQCVVAFCPLTNLCKMRTAFVLEFVNDVPEEAPKKFLSASPAYYAESAVPTLLVHGSSDNVVPLEQSEQLARCLKAKHVPVRLIELQGADHMFSFTPGPDHDLCVRETVDFMRNSLSLGASGKTEQAPALGPDATGNSAVPHLPVPVTAPQARLIHTPAS